MSRVETTAASRPLKRQLKVTDLDAVPCGTDSHRRALVFFDESSSFPLCFSSLEEEDDEEAESRRSAHGGYSSMLQEHEGPTGNLAKSFFRQTKDSGERLLSQPLLFRLLLEAPSGHQKKQMRCLLILAWLPAATGFLLAGASRQASIW
jgi:hypothetical protein